MSGPETFGPYYVLNIALTCIWSQTISSFWRKIKVAPDLRGTSLLPTSVGILSSCHNRLSYHIMGRPCLSPVDNNPSRLLPEIVPQPFPPWHHLQICCRQDFVSALKIADDPPPPLSCNRTDKITIEVGPLVTKLYIAWSSFRPNFHRQSGTFRSGVVCFITSLVFEAENIKLEWQPAVGDDAGITYLACYSRTDKKADK